MRVIAATCSTSAAATTTKHLHPARHRLMNVIALRADPARAQAAHVEVCHRTKPNTRERKRYTFARRVPPEDTACAWSVWGNEVGTGAR
ncbi:hypothetical protein RI054_18g81540 [Pseudoscourfieldia marina]